jgi:ubiquinone/menaquinone biosynthesis C-methylase UbiE
MFNKKYYHDIWGTVHRHDYTESLANRLIQQYGKVRILDCGTGCGHLVKLLREKGADAWGFDVSDYALENSCAKGYIVKAHASKLPFADNSFDVVHSNGLFGYDDNVDEIVKELYRVGKIQDHNIDTSECDLQPEFKISNVKPRNWWNEKLKKPNKVLVTCPVYDGKAYCFDEWVKMAKSLTYDNYDILVVDNSKTEDFYNKYKDQISMIHLDFTGQKDDGMYRVCKSMAEVQQHFLKGDYTHWMNIEADNIPPPNVIETLMKYDGDWVAHTYPAGNGVGFMAGIGCSLLSRKLMTDFDWSDTSIADDSPDSELWNWMQDKEGYKTVEIYKEMDVKHLK